MNDVRIALLSVDHEDMEGYTVGLKALLEEHVVSVASFQWGAVNERNPGRRYDHHHEEQNELTLFIPEKLTVSVSMFMELMVNTANNRPYEDRDQHKTWTFAIYEVVDGKPGRIKLVDQCNFTRSAIGSGEFNGGNPNFARHAGAPFNTSPTFGETSRRVYVGLNQDEKFETIHVTYRDLTANEKTRTALQEHMTAGAKPKSVVSKSAGQVAREKTAAKK